MSPTSNRTVIVVDDEPDIRESLREILEDEGYAVVTAANGAEALALLPQASRPLAMILDIIMPVMSGVEVVAGLRASAAYADVPVVVSTSDPSRAPAGVPVVKKPIDLDRLLAAVSALF